MIVIGADPHKSQHTVAAIDCATGELLGDQTVSTKRSGLHELVRFARALDCERVWAIEDCRHVSGNLERFLIAHGERVVRVAPKLMAGARRSSRERGKSDPIDALAVARAALREGPERLPSAFLDEQAMQIKLLLDHREDLEQESARIQNRLRWHLLELWPELELRPRALASMTRLELLQRRLSRQGRSTRALVAKEQVIELKRLLRRSRELKSEITTLVEAKRPELLELPGCGALTAAKLLAETAGAERFGSDAQLARLAGLAPVPASSGRTQRHRLDRGGNRQLNSAFYRIAVTQKRVHEPARDYLKRKESEGKTAREALRCLKRQLVRPVLRALRPTDENDPLTSIQMDTVTSPI